MRVEVTGAEEAKARIEGIEDALNDKAALHARIAKGVVPVVRSHLRDRNNSRPRKPGWKPSGYWGDAAESRMTKAAAAAKMSSSDASGACITVRHPGVGLHLRGGTVKSSRPGGRLAIPLRAQFAGVNPREAWPDRNGAFVLASKGRGPAGRAFLADREGGALRLCYLLLSSVTLRPDPSVLPPEDRLSKAARAACAAYVREKVRSGEVEKVRSGEVTSS